MMMESSSVGSQAFSMMNSWKVGGFWIVWPAYVILVYIYIKKLA